MTCHSLANSPCGLNRERPGRMAGTFPYPKEDSLLTLLVLRCRVDLVLGEKLDELL